MGDKCTLRHVRIVPGMTMTQTEVDKIHSKPPVPESPPQQLLRVTTSIRDATAEILEIPHNYGEDPRLDPGFWSRRKPFRRRRRLAESDLTAEDAAKRAEEEKAQLANEEEEKVKAEGLIQRLTREAQENLQRAVAAEEGAQAKVALAKQEADEEAKRVIEQHRLDAEGVIEELKAAEAKAQLVADANLGQAALSAHAAEAADHAKKELVTKLMAFREPTPVALDLSCEGLSSMRAGPGDAYWRVWDELEGSSAHVGMLAPGCRREAGGRRSKPPK